MWVYKWTHGNPRRSPALTIVKSRFYQLAFYKRLYWGLIKLKLELLLRNVVVVTGTYGHFCETPLIEALWRFPVGKIAISAGV